jgi:phosphotransferase system HPr-like phosphotransfer protein
MKLRVKKGDTVTISADGPDEKDALTDIAALMEGSFGETAGIQNPVKKP